MLVPVSIIIKLESDRMGNDAERCLQKKKEIKGRRERRINWGRDRDRGREGERETEGGKESNEEKGECGVYEVADIGKE